jgi:hypothetical protein
LISSNTSCCFSQYVQCSEKFLHDALKFLRDALKISRIKRESRRRNGSYGCSVSRATRIRRRVIVRRSNRPPQLDGRCACFSNF